MAQVAELWVRRDSLPPLGKQHSSEYAQVRGIFGCALSVHADCPQNGGVRNVDAHPDSRFSEYIVAQFEDPKVAGIAMDMFNGMNLGYTITEKLEYKPINLVVEWPHDCIRKFEEEEERNQRSKPITTACEEYVHNDKTFDPFRSTYLYIIGRSVRHGTESGRIESVVGMENECFILQDQTRIPRSPHAQKKMGIRVRVLSPAHLQKRPRSEPRNEKKQKQKKPKRGNDLDDIERVLVEINGPGERVRTRFLPVDMTMGEIVKCCDCNVKNVSVMDSHTGFLLSRSIRLSDYSGRGHIRIRLEQSSLYFPKSTEP